MDAMGYIIHPTSTNIRPPVFHISAPDPVDALKGSTSAIDVRVNPRLLGSSRYQKSSHFDIKTSKEKKNTQLVGG